MSGAEVVHAPKLRRWLQQQIDAEEAKRRKQTDEADEAFYDGMADAYRLVIRHLDEMSPSDGYPPEEAGR